VEFQGKADVLTAALRELIITGEFKAGAPLRQRDLAERFGVSPTPVREALRRLEAEGLVEHDLHRGTTVIQAGSGAAEEAYELRTVLESLAAKIAATRATPEDIADLRALQQRFEGLGDDEHEIAEANRRFHFRIYEAARSPILLALLRLLWQTLIHQPPAPRPRKDWIREHEEILEALERGDAKAAERLTRAHVRASAAKADQQHSGPGGAVPVGHRSRPLVR
jgi:DNA-binding GntR family transcriptional regulator